MGQSLDGVDLLKLAVSVVNDKGNPFKTNDISLKDFDVNMSGKFMIDVVTSILSCIDPTFERSFASSTAGHLPAFEELLGSSMVYDATAEAVFKAVRKFFPEDDDTLDLSVFIMPQLDVKKAKQVTIFLMGYFIVSDQVHERFETEWDRLNSENQEKSRLYEEIEQLRNTIQDHVVKLQSAKDAKPQLEAELQEFENQLVVNMKSLTSKEEICVTEKGMYDNKAVVNKRLQAELDSMLAEKDNLERCIVSSPQEIEQLHNIEKQKCMEDEKKRSCLGVELRNIGEKELALSKIIDGAAQAVLKFEELIKVLQIAGDKRILLNNDSEGLKNILREIEEFQAAVQRVGSDQDRLQSEINKRMTFYEQECAKLEESQQMKNRHVDNIEFRVNEIMAKLEEIETEMYRNQRSGEQNMLDVQDLMLTIRESVPNYAKHLARQLRHTMKLSKTYSQLFKK